MIDPEGVGASCWCTRLPHSLFLLFFFETVRTFLVRKVGDDMPYVTDVGEKEFEIVAYVLWFVCRMSSQVCHCLG